MNKCCHFNAIFSTVFHYFTLFYAFSPCHLNTLSLVSRETFPNVFHWKWYTTITFCKKAKTFQEVRCLYEKTGWSITGNPDPHPHYMDSRCVQMTKSRTWQYDIINWHVVKHGEGSSFHMVYHITCSNAHLIGKFIKHAYFWSITGPLMLVPPTERGTKDCLNCPGGCHGHK